MGAEGARPPPARVQPLRRELLTTPLFSAVNEPSPTALIHSAPGDKGRGCPLLPAQRPADARPSLGAPPPGPRGSWVWAPPRRPDRGRGEPDTAGPTGSILRAVLPGSRRLVAISLGSALRRRSRAARGARPASHGVRGPGRRQRPLGHAGPQLLSPSVTTFFREMALREAACLRVWPLSSLPSGKSHSFPSGPSAFPRVCLHYRLFVNITC